ncbi:hypothetical protein B296_00000337 [Ensete ventricosum]|uniref:Uncharacterized protein n=1 Tax=Ensete ventricosum TaxID=4639 RepID=A0A427B2Q4_ENSVE|nr:hypothetical protein B296_00000337 [Ensete ventricosum]
MLRPRRRRGGPDLLLAGSSRGPTSKPVQGGRKRPAAVAILLYNRRPRLCIRYVRPRGNWGDPDAAGDRCGSIPVSLLPSAALDRRRRNMVGRSSNGGGGLWRLADEMNPPEVGCRAMEAECVRRFHRHEPKENQCSSSVVKHIKAPVHLVISLPPFFGFEIGGPLRYKPFVSGCIMQGDFAVGCLREVNIKSGLPATTSTERLEQLDDNEHILSIKIVGGDHRLQNYSSVVTAHPEIIDERPGTLVIESFVVDVPEGNTKDDTCFFVEALIKCNLKSLAVISERLAVQELTEPINI